MKKRKYKDYPHLTPKEQTPFRKGKGQGLDTIAVDHCHTTGKVRGLLCSACNKGIGLLLDDINILENAIKYLKGTHNAKTSDNTESASTS